MRSAPRPKLAVWKFASCDGCQLTLLDCEDELLAIADAIEIANFPEASRAVVRGPYDVSLVEGSITTPHDAERIHQIRRASRLLVTIGACATSGGIQALRNFADVREWIPLVYASPQVIDTLRTSTPIVNHVAVDFELAGCPINKGQLLEAVTAILHGRKPVLPSHPVCVDCKERGTVCDGSTGFRPCRIAVTASSSCPLLMGHPAEPKSTATWSAIGVDVRSVSITCGDAYTGGYPLHGVGEVEERLDAAAGTAPERIVTSGP